MRTATLVDGFADRGVDGAGWRPSLIVPLFRNIRAPTSFGHRVRRAFRVLARMRVRQSRLLR